MIPVLLIGLTVFVMAKIAEAESRSSIVWGALTLVLCLVSAVLVPIGMLAPIIGGVSAFLLMLVANAARSSV